MEYEIKIGNRTRKLKIEMVPYKAYKIQKQVEDTTAQLVSLAQDEALINQRILELRKTKEDGWFSEARALRKEIKGLVKEVQVLSDRLFTDRVELVQFILSKNGVREDDTLMDPLVWMEDLDTAEVNLFINACLTNKKKDT